MNDYDLKRAGTNGDYEVYSMVPSGTEYNNSMTSEGSVSQMYAGSSSSGVDSVSDFGKSDVGTLTIGKKEYEYIKNGSDDNLPLTVLDLLGNNLVGEQSLSFDAFTCYAQGLRIVNREDNKDATDKHIREFCLRNSLNACWMSAAESMKYFYFTVTEIILNREQNEIVRVKNLDVTFCRLEKRKKGKIGHVFWGDFNDSGTPEDVVAIPLLDMEDPLGDLRQRLGLDSNDDGKYVNTTKGECKFAIVARMPKPGCRYYPLPSYYALFRDDWYDIYKLIGKSKKFRIGNTGGPRYQIEVHKDYWNNICRQENITDAAKRQARIDQEYRNLKDFVTGAENAGKSMITNYYVDPNGKEVRMVRVSDIGAGVKKEGGDFSEDLSEASNSSCYAFGVHPSLAGATPGKSQMNNSGSDKRELFNLKQIVQKPFHDIMAIPYHVILHFNGWDDKYTLDIPINQLTTLDENKSHKKVSTSNSNDNENN